jgi:predicted ATPase
MSLLAIDDQRSALLLSRSMQLLSASGSLCDSENAGFAVIANPHSPTIMHL